MGILLALLAGVFMPLTNLTVRKSVDVGGNTKAYFVFQLLSSFLFAVLIGPVRTGDFSMPLPAVLLGVAAGSIVSLMLFALGKAVEQGPPGFTFAILNSATVMPGLLMALFFGAAFGYAYNIWHAMGSLLVLFGLFWAGKGLQSVKEMNKWLVFSLVMFVLHVLLLALYQWRGLLLNPMRPGELFPFFSLEAMKSECFTPFMFLTACVVQAVIYLRSQSRAPKAGEVFYGFAGGLSNLLVTFFLLSAAEQATPLENAIIFPIFSVVGIILTNAWGQKLYQEQVNWRACQLSAFGLIVGTVDWKAVAAVIGF
jgi:multidrug transporter EmrE-like cation transporter